MKKVLVLNGSPQGPKGNCQKMILQIEKDLKSFRSTQMSVVHLAKTSWNQSLLKKVAQADAFIFVTGTYWDSWGSPLQKFLEFATPLEGTKAVLGKPSLVIVLNHSVGGKGVLSRLQGVLNSLGCLIPPMGGMVYSWTTHELLKKKNLKIKDDLWSLDDLKPMLTNLHEALKVETPWQAWPVDRKNFRKTWLKN